MMELFDFIQQLFTDYTSRTIGLGTIVLGIVSGVLGSYAVLRRQSLLGDAIAHAALPGIAITFLILGVKDSFFFLIGAIITGVIGTLWIMGITRFTKIKTDTALGIILTVFFGFGIVLLTLIQQMDNANQAGLEDYLFGQAATLMEEDVIIMASLGGLSLLVVGIFWKELKLLTFDPQYAKTLGFNTRFLDVLITSLIVIAIVLGLQTVGVVLMSAMLLAPAAAARQWTNKMGVMIILAAFFGALAGITGTAISASMANMSTGPTIVMVAVILVVLSFIFSPIRGLLFRKIRELKSRKTLRKSKTLSVMYQVAINHENYDHPHSFQLLNNFRGFHKSCIRELKNEGYIAVTPDNQWKLTKKGFEEAQNLYVQKNESP